VKPSGSKSGREYYTFQLRRALASYYGYIKEIIYDYLRDFAGAYKYNLAMICPAVKDESCSTWAEHTRKVAALVDNAVAGSRQKLDVPAALAFRPEISKEEVEGWLRISADTLDRCTSSIDECVAMTIVAFITSLICNLLHVSGRWSRVNERNDYDKKTLKLAGIVVTLALLLINLLNFQQSCIASVIGTLQSSEAAIGYWLSVSATVMFMPIAAIELAIPGGVKAASKYIPEPPPQEQDAPSDDADLEAGWQANLRLVKFLRMPEAGNGEVELQGAPGDGPDPLKERGSMTVLLIRGRGLKSGGGHGRSDPYVKLCVGSKVRRSRTKRGTVHPEWMESFEFEGVLGQLIRAGLVLRVYDSDPVSHRYDSLGETVVQLAGLEYKKPARLYAKLSLQGDLELRVAWTPESQRHVPLDFRETADQYGVGAAVSTAAICAMRDARHAARVLGHSMHETAVRVSNLLADPIGTTADLAELHSQEYYVVAWNGPRVGDCSDATTPAHELKRMHDMGVLPGRVRLWPKGGDHWTKVADVVAQIKRHDEQAGEDEAPVSNLGALTARQLPSDSPSPLGSTQSASDSGAPPTGTSNDRSGCRVTLLTRS